jgi:NitT/TauT family transport system substrate-binding protein
MTATRRNSLIAIFVLVLAIAAYVFVARPQAPDNVAATSATDAPQRVQVRLKWVHQAQFAGFYAAQETGLYAKNGLAVSLNPGGPDFPAIQLVANGGEDFGVTGADQLILAREKGAPVVAVAVIYRRSPMVMFALEKSGIKTPKDFEGRKVGVKLGGNEELTYRAVMKNANVDVKRITEVPVKFDMASFFTGGVDVWPGYAINELIVAQEKGFPVTVVKPADYGVDLYADTLFTTETMLRDKPQVVERFVRATLEGWAYAIQHKDETVGFTLKQSDKLNRDHEMRMLEASIPLLKPDDKPLGWMDASKWQEMHTLLRTVGFLKSDIDTSRVFTDRYVSR